MAEKTKQSANAQPVEFPANWSKMTQAEKLQWQQKNRPGFNAGARAAKQPEPPQMQSGPMAGPQPGEGGAAHEYNAANEYNAGDQGEEQPAMFDEQQINDAAAQIDARQCLAKILRVLADAFAGTE